MSGRIITLADIKGMFAKAMSREPVHPTVVQIADATKLSVEDVESHVMNNVIGFEDTKMFAQVCGRMPDEVECDFIRWHGVHRLVALMRSPV